MISIKESWKTLKKHQLGNRIKNENEMRHVSYQSDYLVLSHKIHNVMKLHLSDMGW